MKRLDEAKFLVALAKLYEQQDASKGTVWLEMKRYEGHGKTQGNETPKCLIRAHTAKAKSKISTMIAFSDVVRFQQNLGSVLKVHVDNLEKPKKEKDAKKKKAEKPAPGAKAE